MKLLVGIIGIMVASCSVLSAQQRVVAECTVSYKISMDEQKANIDVQNTLQLSTKTVFIKGNDSRVDLSSPSLSQSLIYDKSNGTAVVLREFGNNKFMTRFNNQQWVTANKMYDGMSISLSNETKTILGYECKKAIITLKDGSIFTLFYATSIIPSVKEFEYQFKDVPGFVLEYQVKEQGETIVNYKAIKISLNPVQASKYDIPTSGYRLLN